MTNEMAVRAEAGQPAEGRKASSSRPVDLVHLSRYTLGERALEREVLDLFCTQSVVYIDRLKHAQSDKDWRDAAHSLKGSARAIGAWRAAAAAERAEGLSAAAIAGDALAAFRAERIDEIESSVREVESYIGALLKDR
jgi:HPt (histidine-containing phosphotransfer) domain-containing protein